MSYNNPTLYRDLAAALREQQPESDPVEEERRRLRIPGAVRTPPSPDLTFDAGPGPRRLYVRNHGRYIGDVLGFASGWRAYKRTDGLSIPGVYATREEAAAALWERRWLGL